MDKEKQIASQLINFVTYQKNKDFEHFMKPNAVLLELRREVIHLFSQRGDLNGVFFSGITEKDRYPWSLICQGGNLYSFIKGITIIRQPFFIFAPDDVVKLLTQEFIKNELFVHEYGRKPKGVVPSSFCELYDNGTSLSIHEVEPVCKN